MIEIRIGNNADFKCDDETTEILEDLSLHYIKGRYMVEREKLPGNKRDFAARMIKFAEEVLSWSSKKSK